MDVRELHPWEVTPDEARRIQRDLRGQIRLEDAVAPADIRVVAGVDNSYVQRGEATTAYAVVVVFSFPALELVETSFASADIGFPYVPGLLSFREAPAILAAFRQVRTAPDVILFDGQGYAHPRRLGLASHLGLVLDRPSIGCAKSILVGRYEEPERTFGAATPLVHDGETVGTAVRTRPRHKPLFVSPGHKVSLDTAVRIVLACCRENNFLPEPTRLAHDLITAHTRPLRQAAAAGPASG